MARRLAPLSVPYRIVQRGGGVAFAVAIALFSGASAFGGLLGSGVVVGLVGVAVLLTVGYELAYYRRFEYELTADTLDIRSGVFSRRVREIPLRRIQNVDVRRSVVQRFLGLAVVEFETAGGSETEARFRFVTVEEARRLQDEVARRKRVAAGSDEAQPDREVLFSLSTSELLVVAALSFDVRVPGVLAVLASGGASVVAPYLPDDGGLVVLAGVGVALLLGVLVVSWVAGAAAAFVNYYGFRLSRVGDDLAYERGLLQRYDGTIPLDKVQTLTATDTPLTRAFGYASLTIETAGYTPGQGGQGQTGSESAVPLARRERVFELADAIESVDTPAFERPPKRVRRRYALRYLLVLAGVAGVVALAGALLGRPLPWYGPAVLLPLVPVAAHLKWRHRGYWLGDGHVVTRNGVFKRRTKMVPYYRVQTLIDSRTLFQRRWDVATVTIDTAGSLSILGGDATAVDVASETADALLSDLEARLQAALDARRREGESFVWDVALEAGDGASDGGGDDGAAEQRDDDAGDDAGAPDDASGA